ncbi:MAG: hypothetical protein ACI8RZ_001143 [Myxococcota bacterium]|jgi:hypothetical protein
MIVALLSLLSASAGEEPLSWSRLWMNLPETTERCGDFDYHPGGGMRAFYCHMLSQISYTGLQERTPHPIFLSGPHTPRALKLDDPRSFGHYNPEFVKWLGENLVPGADDLALREQTQGLYSQYVSPLARTHYLTYTKLNASENADCTAKEKARYARFMQTGEGVAWGAYYERWFYYLDDRFCKKADDPNATYSMDFGEGVSGNVVKTTVGFWLRRSMDGTDDEFYTALIRLLETYDSAWLSAASLSAASQRPR